MFEINLRKLDSNRCSTINDMIIYNIIYLYYVKSKLLKKNALYRDNFSGNIFLNNN